MKTLFFLLVGFFCYAHGQEIPKEDSAIKALTEKINLVNQINKENENLLKKRQDESFKKKVKDVEIKLKIQQLDYVQKNKKPTPVANDALKPESKHKPEMEIPLQLYPDYIRGDLVYRLFHKNDYKVKIYTIINNEKVYIN